MAWENFDDEPDETTWMQGRKPGHMYASKGFPLKRQGSPDDGQPARFVYKVFDDDGSEPAEVELAGEVWPVNASPAGRVQIKLLVAREGDRIKDLWIQKFKTSKSGEKEAGTVLHLGSSDAQALCNLFQNLHNMPVEGDSTTRVDDELIRQVFADPSVLATYNLDTDVVRALIEQDASARDVIAISGRRAAVGRFRKLLEDDGYFAAEKTRLGAHGDEAVWQALFEENPWILGIGLNHQLLTSWDENRLEQVVAGYSVSAKGKRADALLRTSGVVRSMVFAEIKTSKTKLLDNQPYRPGAWAPSKEVVGGVSQVHATVHSAATNIGDRISSIAADGSDVPNDWTYLYEPRSFLVVGSLGEFVNPNGGHHAEKIRSFELYRRHTASPEIVTFDELLARAEWIVNVTSPTESDSSENAYDARKF